MKTEMINEVEKFLLRCNGHAELVAKSKLFEYLNEEVEVYYADTRTMPETTGRFLIFLNGEFVSNALFIECEVPYSERKKIAEEMIEEYRKKCDVSEVVLEMEKGIYPCGKKTTELKCGEDCKECLGVCYTILSSYLRWDFFNKETYPEYFLGGKYYEETRIRNLKNALHGIKFGLTNKDAVKTVIKLLADAVPFIKKQAKENNKK